MTRLISVLRIESLRMVRRPGGPAVRWVVARRPRNAASGRGPARRWLAGGGSGLASGKLTPDVSS